MPKGCVSYPAQNIYFSRPLLRQLRAIAAQAGVPLSQVVRTACEHYIEYLLAAADAGAPKEEAHD